MKEVRADGTGAFSFSWPRVPGVLRKEVGGRQRLLAQSGCQALYLSGLSRKALG